MDVEAWRVALAGPPTEFELDGDVYEIAGSWRALLEYLPLGDWQTDLVYALVHTDDLDALDDRLDDDADDLTLDDVEVVAEQLVERATGRRWWVTQRLYATLAADWEHLEGALLLRGVDLAALVEQPARLCNVVYAWLVEGADPQAREQFEFKLAKPPPGVDLDEAPLWSAEEEGAAFMAAMSGPGVRGGRVGGTVA